MYGLLKEAQPKVMRILENSKKNNRLSHAYLFVGPSGTYKVKMAKYFAMMLYCKEEHPCFECDNCKAIMNDKHLNVFLIEPIGSSIKKEQIISLQEEFSKTSLIEGPRVYIINQADTMSPSASNSLLKFIEEPTNKDTYGILITRDKDNILPTIVSRCEVVNFDAMDISILRNQFNNINDNKFYVDCLLATVGNTSEANEKLSDQNFLLVINTFDKFISQLVNQNFTLFYRANIDVLANKDNLNLFLNLLEKFFRDLYGYLAEEKITIFISKEEEIKQLSRIYNLSNILDILNDLLEMDKKISYNVNASLLFNRFLITLRGGKI